jgi:molybdopterin synthase catalytic subunit
VVFVAAAAPHRRDAFLAVDYLMDRLKTEAAFWKRESGPDGVCWIEPNDSDRADLARWSDPCPA